MDTVVCPKCGKETSVAKFCGECGLPLGIDTDEKITTQQRNILLAMKTISEETPDNPSTIPKISEKIKAPVDSVRTMMYQLKARGYTERIDRGGYVLSTKGKTILSL
jgi:Mn-dependent DtxR family transcriptional regulator